jgi:DUF438 domain-containing protein
MSLIKQLKQEHVEILRLLDALEIALNNGNNHEELLSNLRELKMTLVAHLKLEDKLLYPTLANSKNEEIIKLGAQFAEEMTGITEDVLKYFSKYLKEEISDLKKNEEFKKKTTDIKKIVNKRVKIEEEILYPTYEKENKKDG